MARQVNWNDPHVVQAMHDFPTEEIDTQPKLARRITELTVELGSRFLTSFLPNRR